MPSLGEIYADISANLGSFERGLASARQLSDQFAKKPIVVPIGVDVEQFNLGVQVAEDRIKGLSIDRMMKSMGGTKRDFGRSMLEMGRFAQDFAQGGIGGILNNVEGLTMALGLGTGLAGVLTAVGVAAVFVAPKLYDFGRSLVESKSAITPLAESVETLTDKQRENAKAIDALRAKGSLYAEDMERLTKLTDDQARIEARLEVLRERRAAEKTFGPGTSRSEREQGRAFGEMLQEQGGLAPIREEFAKAWSEGLSPENAAKAREDVAQYFDEAIKGSGEAIRRLVEFMPEGLTDAQRRAFVAATPESRSIERSRDIDMNMAKIAQEARDRDAKAAREAESREKERVRLGIPKPLEGGLLDRIKGIFTQPFEKLGEAKEGQKSIGGLSPVELVQEQMRNMARLDYIAKHPEWERRGLAGPEMERRPAQFMDVAEYAKDVTRGILDRKEDKEDKEAVKETRDILKEMSSQIGQAITQLRGRMPIRLF